MTTTSQKNLKGTWAQAIGTFLLPVLIVFGIRWIVVEPFVIPSGSMIPNLLIHDHILVKKYSLGLKIPFSDYWIMRWRTPQRGEVLVFRYPENPDVYYIKRLIGLPGDVVVVRGSGQITVNGQEWTLHEDPPREDDNFSYFSEDTGQQKHVVRFYGSPLASDESKEYQVPEGEYFFMGDNRDQSSDGRVFGYVPEKYLIGPASVIWLSCESTLTSVSYICDPRQIRWKRLFNSVQ
ncbi:signal peptidase I [Bdellovibrio sp. HCB337]|uniref:signal peptidase I n=1 Tax=Bdellovibrio sp. HCB337 TaxID=3394358 RepID=UPI0039A644C0